MRVGVLWCVDLDGTVIVGAVVCVPVVAGVAGPRLAEQVRHCRLFVDVEQLKENKRKSENTKMNTFFMSSPH